MKKLILIIGITFLLTSCYSNPEDTKKIAELEKQIQENNLFEKKKECYKLKSNIEIDIKERYNNQNTWTLKEIFYSPKEKSCFYITEYRDSYITDGNIYDLINLLENKIVITKTLYKNKNGEFENKVKELKN